MADSRKRMASPATSGMTLPTLVVACVLAMSPAVWALPEQAEEQPPAEGSSPAPADEVFQDEEATSEEAAVAPEPSPEVVR